MTHHYTPHRGEIVWVDNPTKGNRACFLVLGRQPRGSLPRRTLRGILCTNETEMATDIGIILDRKRTGAPYTLLAQGELYGYFSIDWVTRHVGTVDRSTMLRVRDLLDGTGDGLPLAGQLDPRWRWKQDELVRMYGVTYDPFEFLD